MESNHGRTSEIMKDLPQNTGYGATAKTFDDLTDDRSLPRWGIIRSNRIQIFANPKKSKTNIFFFQESIKMNNSLFNTDLIV